MSRRGRKRRRPVGAAGSPTVVATVGDGGRSISEWASWIVPGVLVFAFGAWLGVLYFGQRVVPNSDFPSFVATARPLLHRDLPTNFKRLPGLGLMVLALSPLMPGPSPELTAGWLLNALLYPGCLVLLYALGRRWLGDWAAGLAVLFGINPWTVGLLIQPIAEIPLWFFVLLGCWLMARRSRWVYAAAGAAALIRYEGAVLIVAALVVDVWEAWGRGGGFRSRFRNVPLAVLAILPLAAWLVLGAVSAEGGSSPAAAGSVGKTGYWRLFFQGQVFGPVLRELWRITYQVVFTTNVKQVAGPVLLTAGVAAVGWVGGVVQAVRRRDRVLVGILLYWAAYWLAISLKTGVRARYVWPLAWLFWLVSLYGWRHLGPWLWRRMRAPAWFGGAACGIVIVGLWVWLVVLISGVGRLRTYDRGTPLVPFVVLVIGLLVAGIRVAVHGRRTAGVDTLLALLLGVTASYNQYTLTGMLGDGRKDIEFKMLADWYRTHARSGDAMVTTLPHMVQLWLPQGTRLIATEQIGGDDLAGFLADCRRRHVTYIAWDSRLGFATTNSYYRRYRLDRIAVLADPARLGPYAAELDFVDRVVHHPLRFINIYRVRSESDGGGAGPGNGR